MKFESAALVVALVIGILPTQTKTASAASATVNLKNLGSLGTVDYGSKTKSGTWWMMNLSGGGSSKTGIWYEITLKGKGDVFCINLGKACRTHFISCIIKKWSKITFAELLQR